MFEDDTKSEVQPFQIAKYPVSVEQFDRFVEGTGYVTVAEQKHHDQTFRDNQYMDGVVKSKRGTLPALFVSYVDAIAYCEWARVAEEYAEGLAGDKELATVKGQQGHARDAESRSAKAERQGNNGRGSILGPD